MAEAVKTSTELKEQDKQAIQRLEIPFTPLDDKVLVKPMEPIHLKREEIVFKEDDRVSKKKSLKEIEKGPKTETETITKEVKANVRRGVVLSISNSNKDKFDLEEGDVIVYHERPSVFQFDLYRDSVLLNIYDILGMWNITKENDNDIYGRIYKESDSKEQASK